MGKRMCTWAKPKNHIAHIAPLSNDVLVALSKFSEPITAMDLRYQVGAAYRKSIAIGALYIALDRLEKQGLIIASPDPRNRSRHLFKVTDSGLATLKGYSACSASTHIKPQGIFALP